MRQSFNHRSGVAGVKLQNLQVGAILASANVADMQYCGKEAQVNLLLATFADVGNSEVRKNTGRISPAIKNKKQEAVHIRFIDHISNVKIVTPRNKMSKAQVAMLSALMRAKR